MLDLDGGRRGSIEPHPRPNYFIFMGKFMKNQVKCQKRTLLGGFEPLTEYFIPQYAQLVRDIDNYLHTVMSSENITKLLRKLTKSQQKTSLILSVLQEVELWERTQDKFVAMLDEEYPLYRDAVTPFIVAVFQVWNCICLMLYEPHYEKTNNVVSNQV